MCQFKFSFVIFTLHSHNPNPKLIW